MLKKIQKNSIFCSFVAQTCATKDVILCLNFYDRTTKAEWLSYDKDLNESLLWRDKMRKLLEKKAFKTEKGFSLIEVLLAIVILGLVAAPILQLFITSASISKNSKELLAATDVGNITMEYITGNHFETANTGIQAVFSDTSATKLRVPGLGLVCDTEEAPGAASITNHTQFEEKLKDGTISATGTKSYYVSQTNYFGAAFFNVKYDDYMFDMLVSFVPNMTSGDEFYTYDVTVDVYVIDETTVTASDGSKSTVKTNFGTKIVSIDGAIANKL